MSGGKKYKVVVPVSGGKDSQCSLVLAINEFGADNVLGLFCDTQFEHPNTYEHIAFIERHYKVKIERICAGSVDEQVVRFGRFPGGGARHCTDYLKIRPTKQFLRDLAEKQGGFQVFYGMRLDESSERAERYAAKVSTELYAPHEIMPTKYPKYLAKMGVMFRLPILDWSAKQVMLFIRGAYNPLYNEKFDRIGCFPCLAGGDEAKQRAFIHDEFGRKQRERVRVLEQRIGKSVFTSKSMASKENKNQMDMFGGCRVCSI